MNDAVKELIEKAEAFVNSGTWTCSECDHGVDVKDHAGECAYAAANEIEAAIKKVREEMARKEQEQFSRWGNIRDRGEPSRIITPRVVVRGNLRGK